jgi:hypothetical protein
MIGDIFDHRVIRDELLLSYHVFRFICILNLVNPTFEMWMFWLSGNLSLALPRASITHSLFCSLVQMDMITWNMNPGHCALGLAKGILHTCLEPVSSSTGHHLVDVNHVERVQLKLNMIVIFAMTFYHVLVATNMGSL